MPISTVTFRVFLSSPGDVETEREDIAQRLRKLGPMLARKNCSLEVITGRDIAPGMGRPQGRIDEGVRLGDCDIYIGIAWLRFGTPPGDEHGRFLSGTEEEFTLAYEEWRRRGSPEIFFYFCNRPPSDLGAIDGAQFARLQEFKAQFGAQGAHPGLVRTYEIPSELETLVTSDVLRYVDDKVARHTFDKTDFSENVAQFGFLRIFLPYRSGDREQEKRKAIARTNTELRVVAHSGLSFLATIGGRYRNEVSDLLNRKGRFRTVLSSPWCETALLLALSDQEGGDMRSVACENNEEIERIITGSKWYSVKRRDAIDGFRDLKRQFGDNIELLVSEDYMPATVMIAEDAAFFEPYLGSDLRARRETMMATFEIAVNSESYFFEHVNEYWEYVIKYATPLDEFLDAEQARKESFVERLKLRWEGKAGHSEVLHRNVLAD